VYVSVLPSELSVALKEPDPPVATGGTSFSPLNFAVNVLASSLLAAKDFATNPAGSKLAKTKAAILRMNHLPK
jgi:hypothetical protein